MDNLYTPCGIARLKAAARHYRLDAPQRFWWGENDLLARICNGAGPQRWDLGKRKALTAALARYEAAFAIHDVGYEYRNYPRSKIDQQLKHNMIKIWRKDYGWTRWITRAGRAERLVVIPAVYASVTLAGGAAWEGK